ncbi:hypothetical protein [Cylindrospermopsis raciborskii]|uniref:hypothetical protein n=1 Tax=Cylindrospermopsis raciborskii TaxID=77022 RepID=UPI0022C07C3F|nr:hypothetical protein [Cylindrospermopsis raciborskii]MCZ2207315.1 hypothetical protein [Cylindrospermopsis raciborskii PAMP2011]
MFEFSYSDEPTGIKLKIFGTEDTVCVDYFDFKLWSDVCRENILVDIKDDESSDVQYGVWYLLDELWDRCFTVLWTNIVNSVFSQTGIDLEEWEVVSDLNDYTPQWKRKEE